jgi:hypothetical protein
VICIVACYTSSTFNSRLSNRRHLLQNPNRHISRCLAEDVVLLAMFAKNEAADLTAKERAALLLDDFRS